MIWFFLLFLILPIAEIYVLIQTGRMWGAGPTVLAVIGISLCGAWLAKRQGRQVFWEMQRQLQQGALPTDALLDGVLIFAGGLLLLAPGFITDVMGLVLVLPPSRALMRLLLKASLARQIHRGQIRIVTFGGPSTQGPRHRPPNREVIDVRPDSDDHKLNGES